MNARATTVIKPLNPKGADFKYVGPEPTWKFQPTTENRTSSLGRAFAWYNYHYGKRDAKDMLCQYLDVNHRTKDAKLININSSNSVLASNLSQLDASRGPS